MEKIFNSKLIKIALNPFILLCSTIEIIFFWYFFRTLKKLKLILHERFKIKSGLIVSTISFISFTLEYLVKNISAELISKEEVITLTNFFLLRKLIIEL